MPAVYDREALATGGGTQTVTLRTTDQVKAVLEFVVKLTAEGYGAGYAWSLGMCDDAGNEASLSGISDDAAATSNSGGNSDVGQLGLLHDVATTPTNDAVWSVGTLGAGTFERVYSDAPSSAWLGHTLAFCGDDLLDAALVTFDNITTAAAQDVTTGIGFQGNFVIFLMQTATAGQNVTSRLTLGMADGYGNQAFIGMVDADASAAATVGVGQRTDMCLGFASTSGTWSRLAAFTSWLSTGLRITWQAANATPRPIHALVLRFAESPKIGTITADTGGGAQRMDTPFPVSGWLGFTWDQAASTTLDASSADCGRVTIGAGDEIDQGCVWFSSDDAADPTDVNMRTRHGRGIALSDFPQTTVGEAIVTPAGGGLEVTWPDPPSRASQIVLAAFPGGSLRREAATSLQALHRAGSF